eukprot:CAMPEP_0182878340 /NCGR_PEP_ID=MMETSP0034_2-20130328/15297_1 /TAXON_ID=156128 /ORGANISM="Nephroselmis pyriformis, Strain CCMP717" /LENGTH=43 /DNA_ID= /DNA_START= /DNA_END= /DNA_ORIENTATION=
MTPPPPGAHGRAPMVFKGEDRGWLKVAKPPSTWRPNINQKRRK